MVAVTPDAPAPTPPVVLEYGHGGGAPDVMPRPRRLGLVASASMLAGAAIAVVWFWIPLTVLIIAISSIPSVIGFVLAGIVFVYLMRGVERVERVRSEAVFGMGIPIPPRRLSHYQGFQRWAHQLWLDLSGSRFWNGGNGQVEKSLSAHGGL